MLNAINLDSIEPVTINGNMLKYTISTLISFSVQYNIVTDRVLFEEIICKIIWIL